MTRSSQKLVAFTLIFFLPGLATLQGHGPHRPHGGFPGHEARHGTSEASHVVQRGTDLRWWKGNLHTHSLWSDGDDYPEMIVDWYKRHGYHFLGLSDHNILSVGTRWINPDTNPHAVRGGGREAFRRYLDRFGPDWVETRREGDEFQVRLKPLGELRHLFEEPGRFLLIQSEEITDEKVVHVNATNILEFIPPQGGDTVSEIIHNNVEAVLAQRQRTGQAMFPHVNHPNFRWAITAEDLASVERARFFEVYNGHRGVNNYGDEIHTGLDRMWDIILTTRLAGKELGVVYGLSVDDTHNYHDASPDTARPGRGWIMVRSAFLTPEHLIAALEVGDFYATTGVRLRDVGFDGKRYTIEIDPEPGVRYVTRFIGTRRGYDPESRPVKDAEGNPLPVTRIYSDDVGQTLAEMEGTRAVYELTGDEIYVRAHIVSSKQHPDPFQEGDTEVAWTQPVVPTEETP